MSSIDTDPKPYAWQAETNGKAKSNTTNRSRGKKSASFFDLFSRQVAQDKTNADQNINTESSASAESWLDEIHRLGEKLARHQNSETIQAYKKALKKMLEIFVNQGLATEKYSSNRNVLQQKSYRIIRVIDQQLERLVIGILQSQFSQIQILSKIEEIQGLLVNLLH